MSLLDKQVQKEVASAQAVKEQTASSKHKFDNDSDCPECGSKMKSTSVAGPLPAKVCVNCRICLPSTE